jgi:hypothetical protein
MGYMDALGLNNISVWLDELAPGSGAFAYALEWGARLGLPLHGLSHSGGRTRDEVNRLRACEAACARQGVAWNAFTWRGPLADGVARFSRPVKLRVFGDASPPAVRETLLRRSLGDDPTPFLFCPRTWQPASRVLVVYQERDVSSPFLADVLRLCRAFAVAPVVLTISRSEIEARRRQRLAEEAFAAARTPADFDLMAGCEVRTAVAHVARWRKCSHVFLAKPYASPWRRWLRGDALQRLLAPSDSVAFLAIPTSSAAPSAVTALTAGEPSPVREFHRRASARPASHADESLNVPFGKER